MSKFYLSLSLLILFSGSLSAQDAQTIINQYIEATGGLEKWESVRDFYDSSYTWSLKDIFDSKPQLETYENIRVTTGERSGRYNQISYTKDEVVMQFICDGIYVKDITYMNGKVIYQQERDARGNWVFEYVFNGFRLLQASK